MSDTDQSDRKPGDFADVPFRSMIHGMQFVPISRLRISTSPIKAFFSHIGCAYQILFSSMKSVTFDTALDMKTDFNR